MLAITFPPQLVSTTIPLWPTIPSWTVTMVMALTQWTVRVTICPEVCRRTNSF
ncbi:hypothetical protein L843_4140 [Mycobacterium intracellulare MIN_061107_1834]|nr:hypothetical protein L843_4140 [Mycobacterium intracellulare MIN_061107_1834]